MSELNKLRWRCRRGTLELDVILMRYVDQCYVDADSDEKSCFLRLLDLEDADLMRFLISDAKPTDTEMLCLIGRIRGLSV